MILRSKSLELEFCEETGILYRMTAVETGWDIMNRRDILSEPQKLVSCEASENCIILETENGFYIGDIKPPADSDWLKLICCDGEFSLWPKFDGCNVTSPFVLIQSEHQGLYIGGESASWITELHPGYESSMDKSVPKGDYIAGKPVHTSLAAGKTTKLILEAYTGGWQYGVDIYKSTNPTQPTEEYLRTDDKNHIPFKRYMYPDTQFTTAVSGFNDRNMINQCLMYRYTIDYKRNLSDLPDMMETVEYGGKMDTLRMKYRKWFWDGEFIGTKDVKITGREGNLHSHYAIYKTSDNLYGAVICNYEDAEKFVTLLAPEGKAMMRYTFIDVEEWKRIGDGIVIPPRSAVIVI
ncbi:MAG: hypothetical protein FWF15_04690 [Oscillospiraceae bacterium]|nr:hypothetical protein [Oscillospiraceae bacterium]